MKKLLFTLAVSTLLISCEKEVENNGTTTIEPVTTECYCGVIDNIKTIVLTDSIYYETVIYNQCSANDTTVDYIPQTNAGSDKSEGDPHCLGVEW